MISWQACAPRSVWFVLREDDAQRAVGRGERARLLDGEGTAERLERGRDEAERIEIQFELRLAASRLPVRRAASCKRAAICSGASGVHGAGRTRRSRD